MIDISRLSPPELNRFLHIQGLVDRQQEAQDTVKLLRDYYYGNHPVLLTQRQQEFLGPLINNSGFKFSHNLARTIVDTLRERLNIIGFTVNGQAAGDADEDEAGPEAQLAALLWQWWNANRMDSQQIRCYRRTLRDGATYAIVGYDNELQRPTINLHKMDDGQNGITFHRDPTDTNRVLFANRYWHDYNPLVEGKTGQERKTTYTPGAILKYIRRTGADWEPFSDPEDNGVWPIPWRDSDGTPLGIPVIEFANPGGSEMMQIIGLQNALNKSWLDLIAGADASGFPMLVAEYPAELGIPAENEDSNLTGDDENRVGPGRMFEIAGHLHRLEAADLTSMIEVVRAIMRAMAGVSRTPQYYLEPAGGSDVPSGEALKQLESGLVKRAEERQLMFGQSWSDVMAMMVKVARAFGTEVIPEIDDLDIATQWDDPNTRNELVQAQQAQLYEALGMPKEHVWQTAGAQPEQIAAWKDDARLDRAKEIATVADALRTSGQRTTPQTQQFGTNGNGAEASPENIASTQGLNGIQIRAAVELLEKLTRGETTATIALELLVSLGIDRAKAQTMVNEAMKVEATAIQPQVVGNGNL